MAPTLHVDERMALKETTNVFEKEADFPKSGFKATPINPHLFEHASRLPAVERKSATSFQEFSLSCSNTQLGKRTYNEYLKS